MEYYHPHIGGVETLFKNLVDKLNQTDNKITILTNQYNKSLPRTETFENVTIIRLPYQNRYVFTFLSIYSAIKQARDHDIIHTTSYNAAVPAFFASKWTRTKAIITFHEVWGRLWFHLPWIHLFSQLLHYSFEQIILMMKFHRFVAVSEFTKNALAKNLINPEKIVRIYNGIDYNEFIPGLPNPKIDKTRFLYFGRVGISKGLDILINAAQLLSKERDDFTIDLVIPNKMDGITRKVISTIEKKKISRVISIKKSMSFESLKNIIVNVDAVIVPSYSEGFCFAAVETIALGTPLIISGKGALNEVIGGKYLQFDNMDPRSLKSKMINAIEKKWSEKPIKQFHLEDTVQQYIDLYKSIYKENT